MPSSHGFCSPRKEKSFSAVDMYLKTEERVISSLLKNPESSFVMAFGAVVTVCPGSEFFREWYTGRFNDLSFHYSDISDVFLTMIAGIALLFLGIYIRLRGKESE